MRGQSAELSPSAFRRSTGALHVALELGDSTAGFVLGCDAVLEIRRGSTSEICRLPLRFLLCRQPHLRDLDVYFILFPRLSGRTVPVLRQILPLRYDRDPTFTFESRDEAPFEFGPSVAGISRAL